MSRRTRSDANAKPDRRQSILHEPLEPRLLLSGTTYIVDSLADVVADDGLVTLREAIEAANTNAAVFDAPAGSDTEVDIITFDQGLTAAGPATIQLTGNELRIGDDLAVIGPGADLLAIDLGGHTDGIWINVASTRVTIEGLSVVGGMTGICGMGTYGYTGIRNYGFLEVANCVIEGNGCGIYNSGELTVRDSRVLNNDFSGGILAFGPTTVVDSVIAKNWCNGHGGGIHVRDRATIINSLVYGNEVIDTSRGSAIWVDDEAEVVITHTTVAGNFGGSGDVVLESPDTAGLRREINNSAIFLNGDGHGGTLPGLYSLGMAVESLGGSERVFLTPSSLLLDIGDTALAVDEAGLPLLTDLYGNDRVQGASVDLGAAEGGETLVESLCLVAPSGVQPSSSRFPIRWNAVVNMASSISLWYDADGVVNGNEQYLAQDEPYARYLDGIYHWDNAVLSPGTYTIGIEVNGESGSMSDQMQVQIANTSAVTYTVTTLDDTIAVDGEVSFREALWAANTNAAKGDAPAGSFGVDIIEFDPSIWGGTIHTNLVPRSDVEIRGPGADLLTISSAFGGEVLWVWEGARVTVSGLTITGAEYPAYGALNEGQLTLINCALVNNGHGGLKSTGKLTVSECVISGNAEKGIWSLGANATIENTEISDNVETGLWITNATVTDCPITGNTGMGVRSGGGLELVRCTISDNIGDYVDGTNYIGGGVCVTGGDVVIVDSTISRNEGNGGVSIQWGVHNASIRIENSDIIGNRADNGGGVSGEHYSLIGSRVLQNVAQDVGGGLSVSDSTITDCLIAGNQAGRSAGGVGMSGEVAIVSSLIVGNAAGEFGGGIYNVYNSGAATIVACTIAANTAGDDGGGVYDQGDSLILNNSIVALNQADRDDNAVIISGRYEGGGNLVSADPRFVRNPSAGPDDVWGTTDDDYGDLHLTAMSPAVNSGVNALAVDAQGTPLTTDADEMPRIAHGTVDAGAFELQAGPQSGRETPSTEVTSLADGLNLYDDGITLREALYYAGRDGVGTDITFSDQIGGGTIALGGGSLMIEKALSVDATAVGGVTINAQNASSAVAIYGTVDVSLSGLSLIRGSAYSGGALTATNAAVVTLANCTLEHSRAEYEGGAIWASGGSMVVRNCTIVGNWAGTHGSAIRADALELSNCIVTSNHWESTVYVPSGYTSVGGCGGADIFVLPPSYGADRIWGTADDVRGDLRLLATAACIDCGIDAAAIDADGLPLLTDLEGNPRVSGCYVDSGAYEYQWTPGDANQDTTVDVNDFVILKQNWAATDATWDLGDFNGDGEVDLNDFVLMKLNWAAAAPAAPVQTADNVLAEQGAAPAVAAAPVRRRVPARWMSRRRGPAVEPAAHAVDLLALPTMGLVRRL